MPPRKKKVVTEIPKCSGGCNDTGWLDEGVPCEMCNLDVDDNVMRQCHGDEEQGCGAPGCRHGNVLVKYPENLEDIVLVPCDVCGGDTEKAVYRHNTGELFVGRNDDGTYSTLFRDSTGGIIPFRDTVLPRRNLCSLAEADLCSYALAHGLQKRASDTAQDAAAEANETSEASEEVQPIEEASAETPAVGCDVCDGDGFKTDSVTQVRIRCFNCNPPSKQAARDAEREEKLRAVTVEASALKTDAIIISKDVADAAEKGLSFAVKQWEDELAHLWDRKLKLQEKIEELEGKLEKIKGPSMIFSEAVRVSKPGAQLSLFPVVDEAQEDESDPTEDPEGIAPEDEVPVEPEDAAEAMADLMDQGPEEEPHDDEDPEYNARMERAKAQWDKFHPEHMEKAA